ncbi:MAG: YggT family protein [Acetobacter sp.]|nr:YggT family protein [Acetobacter sp.]
MFEGIIVVLIAFIVVVLIRLLTLYCWILLAACLFVNLEAFGILNSRNRIVWNVGVFFERVTEPVLEPVRRIVPIVGGIDISPIVVFFAIEYIIEPILYRLLIA